MRGAVWGATQVALCLLSALAWASVGVSAAHAADACPNAAYRTGAGTKLPDCRAYEQISPADKNGLPVSSTYPAFFSADGDRGVFAATNPFGGDPTAFGFNPYRVTRGANWATDVMNVQQGDLPGVTLGGAVQAVSQDFTKEVVVSRRKLTSDAVEGGGNIYVHDIGSGANRLVDTVPAAGVQSPFYGALGSKSSLVHATSPDFEHIVFASSRPLTPDVPDDGQPRLYRWDGHGLHPFSFTERANMVTRPEQHRFSTDSQRFTYVDYSAGGPFGGGAPSLYQQRGSDPPRLISHSERSNESPTEPRLADPRYFFPAPDGTSVIFASSNALTNESIPPPSDTYQSIYRWNAADGDIEDLLAGKFPTDFDKENGELLVGASDDGQYIYFSSVGVLAAGAVQGAGNLYVLHGGEISLVTSEDFGPLDTLRLSPDGTHIAYITNGEVRTYDATRPSQPPVCASCSPTGTPALGAPSFGYADDFYLGARSHVILNDGRVFFDTPNRLSAADANATTDVYEYVPGGEHRLISGGGSGGASTYDDVSPDGTSVFFATAAPLVPQDEDSVRDIYSARVNGGLASQQVSSASVRPCGGSDCQGNAPSPPAPLAPGTSTLVPFAPSASARYSVGKPSGAALRTLARTGALKLRVKVGGPGRVTVRARAKVGKRTSTVGSASTTARRAGTVTLTLRLSRAARRELARKGSLRVAVSVAFSKAADPTTLRFTVKRARTGSSAKGGGR